MAIDTTSPRSRRALLGGAIGGLAALAAQALGRPLSAKAANGDPILIGQANSGADITSLTSTTPGEVALTVQGGIGLIGTGAQVGVRGEGGLSGTGVHGQGNFAAGVSGFSNTSFGVTGGSTSAAGVHGESPVRGVHGVGSDPGGTGVFGVAVGGIGGHGVWGIADGGWGVMGQDESTGVGVIGASMTTDPGHVGTGGIGVHGQDLADGVGVMGTSTTAGGTGVKAQNSAVGGVALDVAGVAKFSRSGTLVVPMGSSSATQTAIPLSSGSLILVTAQTNVAGTDVQAAVPNVAGSSFTIFLAKAAKANTTFAWLVVG
jgi:hypothetical protein